MRILSSRPEIIANAKKQLEIINKKQKGENHPRYGKHFTEEEKRKISDSQKRRLQTKEGKLAIEKMKNSEYHKNLKGKNNPFYGKKCSNEHKKKISIANTGKKRTEEARRKMSMMRKRKSFTEGHKIRIGISAKKNWQNLNYRNKQIPMILKGLNFRPTKPEKILNEIIEKNNLPFNYVGDGKVILGGFNPDFLSKNPKYIIEVFGDYWHNLPNNVKKDKRKLEAYSKYGYKTLVIWEHELRDINQVLNKIKEFIKC